MSYNEKQLRKARILISTTDNTKYIKILHRIIDFHKQAIIDKKVVSGYHPFYACE